ncbi:MAG: OmpA family protein [Bacteroidetes bacterium]|nr:OmpA family protein [Bacteroidota bacterium]
MRSFITLLAVLLIAAAHCYGADSLAVYFPFGQAGLDDLATRRIDEMIRRHDIRRGEKVYIIGYCDYVGGKQQNKELSYQRAENVMVYLLSKNFSLGDIELCIGKGKIERKGMTNIDGYQADRKVLITTKQPEAPPAPVVKSKPVKPVLQPKPETHQLAEMNKLKVDELVSLNNIYFEPGTHVLLPRSVPQLDTLYGILNDNPKIKIAIEGHICCLLSSPGGHPHKIKESEPDGPLARYDVFEGETSDLLSYARARCIAEYLVKKGIDKKRISYRGLGSSHEEAAAENSPEQEQRNRRVDIRIMGK